MQVLGSLHPQIVHTPVALLVFSALFAIVGRLFDRDWVRKASVLMLVFGFLGAFAAVQSGERAHGVPEHRQGVPEQAIDAHEEMGIWTMYAAGLAVLVFAVGSRLGGRAKSVAGGVGLVLQVAAAVFVGIAGFRGGKLVYEHAANVRVAGQLVRDTGGGGRAETGRPDADERDESR